MDEDLIYAPAVDTSGFPVNPPQEGFQTIGEVQGTSTSNAYMAELEAERLRQMSTRERIAMANQRVKAEEQAMRFAGMQEYQQLLDGGSAPEEAMRRVAHKLYYNAPSGLASILRATRPEEEFTPEFTDVEGGRVFRSGRGRSQFLPDKPPVMPPEVKAKQEVLKAKLSALTSGPLAGTRTKEVDDIGRQLVENSTNWMGQATGPRRPAAAAAPTTTTTQPTPYKEGTILKSRTDPKKRFIVQNGVPVPME
jgi:hypothetical protein